jgi:hypothetical protein
MNAVHAQGAPKAGGSTSGSGGGKPSGSGGTTPSSNNAGGSSVSPSDRPKTNPLPSPSPAPSPSNATPIVIVNPSPQYAPTYITPNVTPYTPSVAPYTPYYAPAPNVPVNIITQTPQPPRERAATAPVPPSPVTANAAILSQIIQRKGNLTRYMIVDAQSKTVSIIRVRLPDTAEGTAEVELESATPYGVKKP